MSPNADQVLASGVAATSGRVTSATQDGRQLASSWLGGPSAHGIRAQVLAFAFARPVGDNPAQTFLTAWRDFMGPKMRTLCSVLEGPVVCGRADTPPLASVASVEAPYALRNRLHRCRRRSMARTSLAGNDGARCSRCGVDRGQAARGPSARSRRGRGRARPAIRCSSSGREGGVGGHARGLDERTPCVGWLAARAAAYGRGVQPTDAPGELLVVALGDSPKS